MESRLSDPYRRDLEALRQTYSEGLPQRIRAIEEAATLVEGSQWDRESLRSLFHLVHRLAGSSAIYGFPAVSEAAKALEELLVSAIERQPTPDERRRFRTLVEHLRQAATGVGEPPSREDDAMGSSED